MGMVQTLATMTFQSPPYSCIFSIFSLLTIMIFLRAYSSSVELTWSSWFPETQYDPVRKSNWCGSNIQQFLSHRTPKWIGMLSANQIICKNRQESKYGSRAIVSGFLHEVLTRQGKTWLLKQVLKLIITCSMTFGNLHPESFSSGTELNLDVYVYARRRKYM